MTGLFAILLLGIATLVVLSLVSRLKRNWLTPGSPQTDDPDVTALLSRLKPLQGEFERLYPKSQRDAAVAERREAVADEVGRLVARLCERYLESDDALRHQIRAFFDHRDGLRVGLLAHVHATADELSPNRDESENLADLRRALAAVSIEDLRTDSRDTFLVLGPLYVSAARAGLSPGDSFLHVAALSAEVPAFADSGSSSTRVFLEKFEESAFFAEQVRPRLAGPGNGVASPSAV